MSDKKADRKAVFAVTERDGKSFWTRVGVGLPNRDGSINIFLDALPVAGKLQLRDESREEESDGDREERPERRTRR